MKDTGLNIMANLCNNVIIIQESNFSKIAPLFSPPLQDDYLNAEGFLSDLDFSRILPIPENGTAIGTWGVHCVPFATDICRKDAEIHISFQTKYNAPLPIVEALARQLKIDLSLYAVELGCKYGVSYKCYFDDDFDGAIATEDDIDDLLYIEHESGITDEICEIVYGMSEEELLADVSCDDDE